MSDQPPSYAPPPPEGYGARPPRGDQPAPVKTAVNLIWATIALSVISTILTVVLLDSLVDTALEADTTGISEDALRTGVIVGAVIWLVLSAGISILLAVFIGKGHNWARIVYTILGGIAILFTLVGLVTGGGGAILLTLVDVLASALTAAVIFLLWKSESSAWFAAR
jgi:hypothetical protein